MKMKLLIGVVIVGLLGLMMSAYTVDERERAILLRFKSVEATDIGPGLHWKVPFVNTVRKYDTRILTLDAQPERFLTIEKKNVTVDFFVKWRIASIYDYHVATLGDETVARSRLSQIMKDGLRNEFSRRTIQEAVSGERAEIMENLRVKANESAGELGIEIVDVRISRIDLPDEVSDSVYARMRAERARVAQDFRARGQEAAERIRAEADREAAVIIANAYREAEKLRGEGDASSAEIYARAYQRDPEFYSFYRSLNAYRSAFSNPQDVLILEPDAEFFQYFNQSTGK